MHSSSSPQHDPILRFQRDEPRAFEALVDEYGGRLTVFFHRHVWDRGVAEDLAQEVFLKIFRAIESYEPQGCPSTYVWRVARNVLIDHVRAQKVRPQACSLDREREEGPSLGERLVDRGNDGGPLDTLQRLESLDRLSAALDALSLEQRLAFEMGVLEALPYAEVGAILEIPVGTVKSRIFNAVRTLRRLLPDLESSPGTGASDAPRVRGGPRGAGLGRGSLAPSEPREEPSARSRPSGSETQPNRGSLRRVSDRL